MFHSAFNKLDAETLQELAALTLIVELLPPEKRVGAYAALASDAIELTREADPATYPFKVGLLSANDSVVRAIDSNTASELLERHRTCDWGDLPFECAVVNDADVNREANLVSWYRTTDRNGDPCEIWITTFKDRSWTNYSMISDGPTGMLPERIRNAN